MYGLCIGAVVLLGLLCVVVGVVFWGTVIVKSLQEAAKASASAHKKHSAHKPYDVSPEAITARRR